MTLNQWLEKFPAGKERVKARCELAAALAVSEVYVRSMANGHRRVPAEIAPKIENFTDGAVSCRELRPDVFGESAGRLPQPEETREATA